MDATGEWDATAIPEWALMIHLPPMDVGAEGQVMASSAMDATCSSESHVKGAHGADWEMAAPNSETDHPCPANQSSILMGQDKPLGESWRQARIDFIKDIMSESIWRLPLTDEYESTDEDEEVDSISPGPEETLNEDTDVVVDIPDVKRQKLEHDDIWKDNVQYWTGRKKELLDSRDNLSAPFVPFISNADGSQQLMPRKQQEKLLFEKINALDRIRWDLISIHYSHYPGIDRIDSRPQRIKDKRKDYNIIRKIFNLNLELNESKKFPDDNKPNLEEEIHQILRSHDLMEDDITANLWMIKKALFRRHILELDSLYKAVKRLYVNFPYIQYQNYTEVQKLVDTKSEPFINCDFTQLMKIYKRLLRHSELLFHPLLRKSYKNEFFYRVDLEAKIAERKFIMMWRDQYFPRKSFLQKLSQVDGLRDKEYEDRCKQIRLQEVFDYCLDLCKNVKPDCCMEDLIRSESTFSQKD